jgi:bacteriorhodopsin
LVYNILSFTIATMGASFIFFVLGRQQVGVRYRPALLVSALVVAIACYHYVRIFDSFDAAYSLTNGSYMPTGKPFNDAYRYVDWLLTVPLLLVELVAVLQLPRAESGPMLRNLAIAAVLMNGLGSPGEIEHKDMMVRGVWGFVSSIPFAYILFVLWGKLGQAVQDQTERVRDLLGTTRLLLLATWGVYPITYLLPQLGVNVEAATVGIQVGYAIADVLAKAGYGLLIYAIARAKSEADGSSPELSAHAS